MRAKGFTLAEVLVAAAIGAITITALISIYIHYQRNFIIGDAYLDINSNARIGMDWMERDIKSSRRALASWGGYSANNNQLVLEVPSINASGGVIDIRTTFDHIIYNLQGSDLRRIVTVNALSARQTETRILGKNCNSLTFSSGGAMLSDISDVENITEVTISLVTNKTVADLSGASQKTLTETLTSTVELRNRQ